MKYDEISDRIIYELPETDFKTWLYDEVTDLMSDFGQKVDNEILVHTCRRLAGVLQTKYRSWHVATVHACFQTGLAGNYGTFHKVTVKALLYFLNMAQKQLTERKVTAAEEESDRRSSSFNPKQTLVIDFIIWATNANICLTFADPTHDPIATQRVSAKITALAEEWSDARDMNLEYTFKNRLQSNAEKFSKHE